jgi:hypothetical protein
VSNDNLYGPEIPMAASQAEADYQQWLESESSTETELEQLFLEWKRAEEEYAIERQKLECTSPPLYALRTVFEQWLVIPDVDWDIMEFILAVFKSREIAEADPLWAVVIGPSGGGKSEFIRTLLDTPGTFHLSKPTPNSLASGWRGKGNSGNDPSLLLLMDGKLVLMPDFAPILDTRAEVRNEILSILREAFDGAFAVGKGNIGHKVYKSRFSMLVGSTPVIDRYTGESSELGERFVKIRLRGDSRVAKAKKASSTVPHVKEMRAELKKAVQTFLASTPKYVGVENPMQEKIASLADFTALARSPIHRDRFSREIDEVPCPEEGGRLARQLNNLIMSLALVRGRTTTNADDLALVRRVAEDCLPPARLRVLNAVRTAPSGISYAAIQSASGLAKGGPLSRVLEEFLALKILKHDERTGLYSLHAQYVNP